MASSSLNNYVSRKLSSHLVISPAFEISLEVWHFFKSWQSQGFVIKTEIVLKKTKLLRLEVINLSIESLLTAFVWIFRSGKAGFQTSVSKSRPETETEKKTNYLAYLTCESKSKGNFFLFNCSTGMIEFFSN